MAKKRRRTVEDALQKHTGAHKKQRISFTSKDDVDEFFKQHTPDPQKKTVSNHKHKSAASLVTALGPENKPTAQVIRRVLSHVFNSAWDGWLSALPELFRQLYIRRAEYEVGVVPGLDQFGSRLDKLIKSKRDADETAFRKIIFHSALIESSALTDISEHRESRRQVIDELLRTVGGAGQSAEIKHRFWATRALCDFVQRLHDGPDERQSSQQDSAHILQHLTKSKSAKTPEGLWLWLTVRHRFPDVEPPEKVWHRGDPSHPKNRPELLGVLWDSSSFPADSAGFTNPPLWGSVFEVMIKPRTSPEHAWAELVDSVLFDPRASALFRTWGFTLVAQPSVFPSVIDLHSVLSGNLVAALATRYDNDSNLRANQGALLKAILNYAKKNPDTAPCQIFNLLLHKAALATFDQATRTKTLEEIFACATPAAAAQVVQSIVDCMAEMERVDNPGEYDKRRQVADLLLQLLRTRNDSNTICGWKELLIRSFTHMAYFEPVSRLQSMSSQKRKANEDMHRFFQSRLAQALAHLLSKSADSWVWPFCAVTAIKETCERNDLDLAVQLDTTVQQILAKADQSLTALDRKAKLHGEPVASAIRLLYALALLQVYNGDADAASVLPELDQVTANVLARSKEGGKPVDAIMDFILSFLPKSGALPKKMAEEAFKVLAPALTEDALEPLYDILSKKESLTGQQELFDEHRDEDSDEAGSDSVEEDASDVEMVTATGPETPESSSESGSDSDSEGASADAESDDGELARLDALLAQTLRTSKPAVNGTGAPAASSGSSDESDMDSDAMATLDDALSAAFRQRRAAMARNQPHKKTQRAAREQIVNFKARVLDLLALLPKAARAPLDRLVPSAVFPLLQLMRSTRAPHVADRAAKTLAAWFEACGKRGAYPSVDADRGAALLRQVHAEAGHPASNAHAAACSRASLFVAKAMLSTAAADPAAPAEDRMAAQKEAFDAVAGVYAETMSRWFAGGAGPCHVRPAFFTNWIGWADEMRKGRERARAVERAAAGTDVGKIVAKDKV